MSNFGSRQVFDENILLQLFYTMNSILGIVKEAKS